MKSFSATVNGLAQRGRVFLKTDRQGKRYADGQAMKVAAITFVALLAIVPELASAAPWDGMATQILSIFTSGLTRTIAIIAVIACGIAAIAGKLSWDWAIKIVVGVVLIFGSTALVDYMIAAAA